MLTVVVRHSVPGFSLDVSFDCGPGMTALVGPSGAGKTMLLNVIAGIVRPQASVVRLGADVLADTAARVWIPPHRRPIAYVFQEPRLFPHLTVRRNLAFGRWFRNPAAASRTHETDVIELLALGPLIDRYPSKLSGGEKQRVALGRALLTGPRLLLLDEPLASVDRGHRDEILPYLDRVRAEFAWPMIYVTHSPEEVAGRAARVIALVDGRVSDGFAQAIQPPPTTSSPW